MEKYTLQMPRQHDLIGEQGKKWFVGVEETYSMHLRPSLEILESTGYSSGENVGFWDTYEEALNAKEQYKKRIE